ncbi:O-antigen polymerase [Afipia sp. GAS231]|uniref:O-antigen polymerase n=1 Tax=Afipia sp. GAS231 TaxID=1882747 RepID=UPI00087A7E0C|nr:O-antigen polymerase [Afipia sp. GAS231]SDN37349.1 oligosaccharide repeat unit polymerase [Afipia sp. GAS231]
MEQFVFHTTRVTPERALFGAWSCWLVCLLLMPVSVVFYGTFETVTLFISANVALWLGLSFASSSKSDLRIPAQRLVFDERDVRLILLCLIVAGAVAIVAKTVDLVAYRGILQATSLADARLKMEVNGSNLFSGLYFGLSPAILTGGVVAVVLFRSGRYNGMLVAALIPFCINPLFSFVYGGRSVLFLVAGLAIISWLLTVPTVSRRHVLCVLGLVSAVFVVTMYLFVSRAIESVGVQVDRLASMSGYTKLVPLDAGTIATMRDLPDLGRYALYYVTSVGQYTLHGVFEFFYLVQAKGPDASLLWGKYQFTLYDQVQRAILGPGSVSDLETHNPTSGLFSTFWGPAYIDFGYLIVVYGFAFGYVTGRIRRLIERGDLFALPLYTLLIFQIFLVPIVNGILLASSVILNIGFFGIWLLTRWYLGRRTAAVQVVA